MISVVMGVYNGEKQVAEAVQSICRQTFRDFEFIIVDDGSTDRTADILHRCAAEDSRIHLLSLQPNQGLVAALNRGCAAARGEFIARMDADDVSLPDRFEKQIGFLRMHPRIRVLGDASQFIQDGVLLDLFERPPLRHREILEVLWKGNPVVHTSIMMKRDDFEAVGGYRQQFVAAEDLDLWLRLAERHEMANLEDVVVYRGRHSGQVTFRRVAQMSLSALAARYAAKVRPNTGRDPCVKLVAICPKSLMAIGVPSAAIRAA